MIIRAIVAVLFALLAMLAAQAKAEDAVLVVDASGSMWGQINEEAKIAIAKRVLGEVIDDIPAERRIGLIAYGHRREGDCKDIEEVAPIGSDRAAIKAAVTRLSPKGKTPMSDAVKLAAERLQHTKNKATVILVSDGIETCEPDPCGVASALEAAGADFTVHVVGFDVSDENAQAQLRCIAENTGGKFVSASNAGELGDALKSTIVETAPPPAANLYLRATELEGGLVIGKGLTWTVKPSVGGEAVISETGKGEINATVAPGSYDVSVTRPLDGLKGEAKGVIIQSGASKTVTIALIFPVEATVSPIPAATGTAGVTIKVGWTGPDRQGDFISVAKKEADAGAYEVYSYAARGNPVEVRLPVEPGVYEVRYVLGRPYRILARTDYSVTPASATLTAKESALAGETVEIEFTGPPPEASDFITIVNPDDPDTKYMDYAYTRNGSPASIRMPLEAGAYELRFVQAGSKVLARRPIVVAAAEATVSAKTQAVAGEEVEVVFTGPPAGSGDYLTVVKPDDPETKYLDYAYAKNGSPAKIRMPLEAGAYEIRFVQGGKKVLARQAITVTDAKATISGKPSAIAGETIDIAFTGPPAGSGDYITVAEADAPETSYMDYAYVSRGSPVEVRMPLDAGDYELRYVQGSKKVIARRPIAIAAASATLSGPAQVKVGTMLSVEFAGPPPGSGDYVTIAETGAPDTRYLSYFYTTRGSPAELKAPETPGDYELRFIQASKKVLARKPLKVIP
ncbi:MAG: VWA domain-containing protein [Pseudomonadota bacterium]|nr:VWA domain-containing protein [Pseudomonadota bacterium]